ncbi:hypothetical protein [Arsenicicoccus piscis]|uniref:Ig-like domain-containing protein n=1 Tax=Arsenicicoccus piscis TaxID=673954 RepID=A0ABQ6HIV2_9MICO|nr:hypothetical protein [Arsenicicoccus piscis]GMA18017.1 hypothetical protein GCM10025862_00380 [Arsenicicoccus piscis]
MPTSPASYAVPLGAMPISIYSNAPAGGYGGGIPLGAVLSPTVYVSCEAGTSPTTTRQWLRDGRPVAGATGTPTGSVWTT